MAAEAIAAKINQIGSGALRRPRRAAPLPRDDCPSFEAAGLEDVHIEEEGDFAMIMM